MKLLLFIFCLVAVFAYGQQDVLLKELGIQAKKTWKLRDSVIINQLNTAANDSLYGNVEKAQGYARIARNVSKKIEYSEGTMIGIRNLINCKIYMSDYDSALIFINELLPLIKRESNPKLIATSYETIGKFYDFKGKYDEAVSYYLKAIGVAAKHDSSITIMSYHNLGLIYKKLNNYKKAYEYQNKAESIARKTDDYRTLASTLNNLGILKKNEKKYQEAMVYYEEALDKANKIKDHRIEGAVLGNMSTLYFELGDSENGTRCFQLSLKWTKSTNSYYELAMSYINFSYNLLDFNQLRQAEAVADTAVNYSKLCKNHEFIMESYLVLAEIKAKQGKYAGAYTDMNKAFMYKDSMNLVALSNEISGLTAEYERKKTAIADSLKTLQLKKEFEADQQLNAEKLWFRDFLLILSFLVLVLVAIGAFLLLKSNRKVKAKNKIVEEQHKEITDSINYAQRIQSAMISNDEAWKQISPHRSIFFQPKDVVSGDFYWAHFNEEKNLAIWCVADCTGHGVPGAFMSVLGSSFLTDIVVDDGETDPAIILNLLRKKVISALTKKGENQPKDGMDLALCVWEKDTNVLHFAGANNPLYLMRKRENLTKHEFTRFIDLPEQDYVLLEVPPNKMPIGSYSGNEAEFIGTQLQLHIGDTLILSTDGYADQFGGGLGKKLKSRPFKEFLLGIQNASMLEQSALIEKHFEDWKGECEQLDDVCIVGVRIS